jgi:hypothetical protein
MSQIYLPITASGLPGSVPTSFVTQAGTAVPVANVLNVLGAGGITTSGAGSTVTITGGSALASSFVTDSGTATPVGGVLNVVTPGGGTEGVMTSGAGNTITVTVIDTSVSGTATTVGATSTVLNVNVPVPLGSAISFRVNIVGNDTAGGVAIGGEALGTFKNFGGVVSVSGQVDTTINRDALLNTGTFSLIVSGTNVQVSVTGVAGHTIDWRGNIDTVSVT